ncbi:MAG: cytochrome C [Acidobacteria bacterium]|nr:MAG: hypothetical protein AUH13_15840 [Acidobacteria bacterium 13_2_20CM_58_27]PYT82581.1 MAG: cytochrome C [Acidobacteriota bacterium]
MLVKNVIRKAVASAALVVVFSLSARAQSEPETIYKAKCAGCHGLDGSANTKAGKNTGAHDFRAPDTDTESDANLVQIVTKGKKKMPKFEEKLKPKEIKELVAYIRGFSRKGQ